MTFKEIRKRLIPSKNKGNKPVCIIMNPETIRYHQDEFIPPIRRNSRLCFKITPKKFLPVEILSWLNPQHLITLYEKMNIRKFKITLPKTPKPEGYWEEYRNDAYWVKD